MIDTNEKRNHKAKKHKGLVHFHVYQKALQNQEVIKRGLHSLFSPVYKMLTVGRWIWLGHLAARPALNEWHLATWHTPYGCPVASKPIRPHHVASLHTAAWSSSQQCIHHVATQSPQRWVSHVNLMRLHVEGRLELCYPPTKDESAEDQGNISEMSKSWHRPLQSRPRPRLTFP